MTDTEILENIMEKNIMKKYRKKPIVEAIQYDKASIGKAQDFCNKKLTWRSSYD